MGIFAAMNAVLRDLKEAPKGEYIATKSAQPEQLSLIRALIERQTATLN